MFPLASFGGNGRVAPSESEQKRISDRLIDGDKKIWAPIDKLNDFLSRVEQIIEKQHKEIFTLETNMGRAADAINQQQSSISALNSTISSQSSQISSLQSSLATAQANAYDAADVAAINSVLGSVSLANSNAPSGQTNISAGAPTTAAAPAPAPSTTADAGAPPAATN